MNDTQYRNFYEGNWLINTSDYNSLKTSGDTNITTSIYSSPEPSPKITECDVISSKTDPDGISVTSLIEFLQRLPPHFKVFMPGYNGNVIPVGSIDMFIKHVDTGDVEIIEKLDVNLRKDSEIHGILLR